MNKTECLRLKEIFDKCYIDVIYPPSRKVLTREECENDLACMESIHNIMKFHCNKRITDFTLNKQKEDIKDVSEYIKNEL